MKKPKYYIGLDVHKEKTTYVVKNQLGDVLLTGEAASRYETLQEQLFSFLPSSIIGLEASTSYYTVYQQFLRNGYQIKVADTIQLRQLIAKNDTLDAKRLAEMLRLGTYPCSYIPDEHIQRIRNMVQIRHALMEEKVRCNARIQAFLDRNKVIMPSTRAFSKRWRQALMQYMGSSEINTELRYAYDHFIFLEKKMEQVDQELQGYARKHWPSEYHLLQSITGIGPVIACYIIAQVFPIKRFPSNKKLRRYAGVIPVSKSSGNYTTKGRIPKASSRTLLRWALIQAANTIGKTKTPLGSYYRMKKKQKKNAGIAKVAVASSLIDIIYKVLTTKKPYQINKNT